MKAIVKMYKLKVINQIITRENPLKSLNSENLSTKWVKVVKSGKKIITFAIILIISVIWLQL